MSTLYVLKDGEQSGPYTEEELASHVEAGTFGPTDMVWAEGYEDWMPLANVLSVETEEPEEVYFEEGNIQVTRDHIRLDDTDILLGTITKASVEVEKVKRLKPLIGSIVVGVIVLCVGLLEIPRNTTTAWVIWGAILLGLVIWWLRMLVTGLRKPSSMIVIDLVNGNERILQADAEVAVRFEAAARQALADFRARMSG